MSDNNLELVIQLKDLLTNNAEKMAQSLNHIAISSRMGAQSLDRMEQKLEQLGKKAEKTKKSLKDMFVIDISGAISSVANTLIDAGKTFFGYIESSFKILAQNEEIGETYLKILGDQGRVSRYIAYNHELAAKYAVIGSQAMDKLGKTAVIAGFRGDQYKASLETASAVENIRKGGEETMKEVLEAESKIRNRGLKNPDILRSIFGLSDSNISQLRKDIEKTYGLTLEDLNKKIKTGKISGEGLLNLIQQQVAKGNDFAKALQEGSFSAEDLIGKFKSLPNDLITSLQVTEEWASMVKELNNTWQLLMPSSKLFGIASKGINGIFSDMLKTITSIIKSFNSWLGEEKNILWLRKEFEDIKEWLKANIWQPLTDPNVSVIDKIKKTFISIGSSLTPIIGKLFADAIAIAFISIVQKPGEALGDWVSRVSGADSRFKSKMDKEDNKIEQMRKVRDEERARKGFSPIGAEPVLQSLPQQSTLLPQKPIEVKVVAAPKMEPYEYRAPVTDKSQTHEYNFDFSGQNFDLRGYNVPGVQHALDEGVKFFDKNLNNITGDVKKSVQRALENVRSPKDNAR